MTFVDLLSISSTALLRHKIRSGLTVLGIIIGILTVSAITSAVRGVDRYVANLLGGLGSQRFVVSKLGLPLGEEEMLKALRRKEIPPDAALVIKSECPSVQYVAPKITAVSDVKSGRLSADQVEIQGTSTEMQYMSDVGLDRGRYFSRYEVEHARQVCIVGDDVAHKVFAGPDPMGKTIYIKGHRFTVIGSHAKMGTVLGLSQDSFVQIPFTTFKKIFGRSFPTQILVRSRSPETLHQAIEEVRAEMRRFRKLRLKQDDDFGILTSEAIMRLWRQFSTNAFIAMIGVGGISLLVGGIGIMNIMLVSVKERTSEIGIRRAIGAARKDIMLQFLIESSLLCLVGGSIGVGMGLAGAKILSAVTHVPVSAEWWAVGLSILVAVGVGIFFGVYPAFKGASLDPVRALRYEQ